jgi:hypothetical protein
LIVVATLVHQNRTKPLPALDRAEITPAAAVREVTAIALLAAFLCHSGASASR